jgi:hypothetical protein
MSFRSNFHLMAFAGFGLLAAMAGFSQSADAADEWPAYCPVSARSPGWR